VGEHPGELALVRVNVDEAPATAEALGIRSIPAVIGFRDGAVAAEFGGAQPERVVRRFLEALLPTPADRKASEAADRVTRGDPAAAEAKFQEALGLDPRHARALLGLARLRGERGETSEALELLGRIVAEGVLAREAEQLAAELRTGGESTADESMLRLRIAETPGDLGARLELGRLLAAESRWDEALPELLAVVERDASFEDEAARRAMLDIFAVLGTADARVESYRKELARVLFR
jgi:putative thioredoxin